MLSRAGQRVKNGLVIFSLYSVTGDDNYIHPVLPPTEVGSETFLQLSFYTVSFDAVSDLLTDRNTYSACGILASCDTINDENFIPVRPTLPVSPSKIR